MWVVACSLGTQGLSKDGGPVPFYCNSMNVNPYSTSCRSFETFASKVDRTTYLGV